MLTKPVCKECGLPLSFLKMSNGSLRPVALDGSDHFDKCAEIKMRLMRTHGRPFTDQKGEGYLWRGKTWYTMIHGKTIVGKDYNPCPNDCDIPPWEDCYCSATILTEQANHLREILG